MNVDPESLIPKLPRPQELQPFPTKQSISFQVWAVRNKNRNEAEMRASKSILTGFAIRVTRRASQPSQWTPPACGLHLVGRVARQLACLLPPVSVLSRPHSFFSPRLGRQHGALLGGVDWALHEDRHLLGPRVQHCMEPKRCFSRHRHRRGQNVPDRNKKQN